MIDTKIACQCGNRFKFGMDLVNGRAPEGLVCPTCGAPATAACNALVDFLSGKEPPPIGAGSRPLKEIRVVCACGARYKFDLELAEKEMPGAVTCPGCQADLTALANEEIRTYITKHAADLAPPAVAPTAPPAVAPTAAPAAAPATAQTPAPAPAPLPAPAVAPAAEALPAAAEPVAPPAPPAPAPVPPPPAAPATPPPDGPATPVATAAAVTPVSDPFGPAPTGKTSGPNLKPLEAPKPNRPPPGSKPATPPARPPGAPAAAASPAKPAKPDAAKPAAKPAVKPSAASGTPQVGLGVAGAVAGALVGAALWFVVLKFTTPADPKAATPVAAWMATVTGVLAGLGARLLGRGASPQMGGAACGAATLVICLMAWVAMGRHIDRQMAPQLAAQFKAAVDRAQAAVNAKSDAELRPFVAQTAQVADLETARVSDDAINAFKATELPKMKEFLADKDNRAKFEARQRALYRAMYPFEDVWQETFGVFGLLFLLGGIIAAAKLAMK